jgi:NADPH:quinone reductase-like Zn-dependent oxidoreductase
MKAALCRRYGPPETVTLETLPRPAPGPGEVLVKVQAAGLTVGDARIRGARAPGGMGPLIRLAFGLRGPRRPVLGREFAGHVVQTGAGVTRFAPGDAVMGITPGMTMGAHAEYVALPAGGLIRPRPDSLTPVEAAGFFFGGLTAADFLIDQCALRAGEHLLVVGATGAVGSAAVQIARHIGARITALASPANHALARELGADDVLDYRSDPAPGPFDVILDGPGVLTRPLERLAPGGRAGLVTAGLGALLGGAVRPERAGGRRLCAAMIRETPAALDRLLELHRAGHYRPLIGETLGLSDIARAHALADSGHKRGNLVITMDPQQP